MKKYITPDIEIDRFQTLYAITTSNTIGWGGEESNFEEDEGYWELE
jgi:hypothetical protein